MLNDLHNLWLGFTATWPLWLFIATLAALCIYLDRACREYKRGQRVTDVRAEESRKTLAYLNDPAAQQAAAESYQRHAEELARYQQAGAYRRNFGQSPANQQTPAPWFGSDGAA